MLVTFGVELSPSAPLRTFIYQRGERVGELVCTIHGHCPGYLVVGPVGQGGTGDGPHPRCLHIHVVVVVNGSCKTTNTLRRH